MRILTTTSRDDGFANTDPRCGRTGPLCGLKRDLHSLLVRIAVLRARSAPSKHCQPAKGEIQSVTAYQGRVLGWFRGGAAMGYSSTMESRRQLFAIIGAALGLTPVVAWLGRSAPVENASAPKRF